jgi:hypothetical protein
MMGARDDYHDDRAGQPGPLAGMAELRDVDPPPSLLPGVMKRIAERPAPGFWGWLRRPLVIQLRVSPVGAALAGAGFAVAAALLFARQPPAPIAPPGALAVRTVEVAAPAAPRPVLVRLRLEAKGAKRVAVAGSFNQWSTEQTLLEPSGPGGIFVGTLALPPGEHEYMFVVDGHWVTDPAADERRPDGFGRQNALLRL